MDGLTLNMTAVASRFASDMRTMTQRLRTEGVRVVRDQMADTRQVIIQTTPIDTTHLQKHWGPVQVQSSADAMTASVDNPVEYGPVLEFGGYRGVGPRTVRSGGGALGAGFTAGAGIYSTQAPLGFVRRALAGAWPGFSKRIMTMLTRTWPYTLEPAGDMGPSSLPLTSDLSSVFGVDIVGSVTHGPLSQSAQRMAGSVLRELRSRKRRRS